MSISISGNGTFTGVSTSYSFDQSVSIGGTLTYEDVTNIDSVGVVTARSGVYFGSPGSGTQVDGNSNGIGIGIAAPTKQLHVSGTGQQNILLGSTDAGGALLLLDGDANGDGNGGDYAYLWHTTAGDLDIANGKNGVITFKGTSDAVKARIDTSGRLLVGTTSEFGTSSRSSFYSKIQVKGNTYSASSDGRITLGTEETTGSDTPLGAVYFCDVDGGDRALIRGYSTSAGGSENYPGYLTFWTNSGTANPTERMRISSNGEVRIIGTMEDDANNAYNLVIRGDDSGTNGESAQIFLGAINAETRGTVIAAELQSGSNNHDMLFKVSGLSAVPTERMRIDSTGRLLVGASTGSGYGLLIVQGGAGSSGTDGTITLRRGGNNPINGVQGLGVIRFEDLSGGYGASISALSDGSWSTTTDCPTALLFSTTADAASSPTERMRIDNSGNVGINVPVPSAGASANSGVAFRPGSHDVWFNHANGVGSGIAYAYFSYNSGAIGSISQNGTTAVSYNTTSDYRLKENIVPLTGATDRVNQLEVRRFNFIADPDRVVDGFVAHEVQAVVPEAITGEKDAVDDDGNPIYQGIDQSKLVPLLTAALQEALAKIETLEARLDAAGL